MSLLEYLSIFRRRWVYLALGLVGGVLGGVLTAEGGGAGEPIAYQGTNTIIVDSTSPASGTVNLEQVGLLATVGPIPDRVAARLDDEGLPSEFSIESVPDSEQRAIDIVATAATAEAAEKAANYTAEEVIKDTATSSRTDYDASIKTAQSAVDEAKAGLADLDAQLAVATEGARPALEVQRQ